MNAQADAVASRNPAPGAADVARPGENLLWPRLEGPGDLAAVEAVPLSRRALPPSTYEMLVRAAGIWGDRVALSVMPDASRWRDYAEVTFDGFRAEVTRAANVLARLGVGRGDAVGLLSPNCLGLVYATVAAQTAGIAAPLNPGLSPAHLTRLLEASGARVLVTAGPEVSQSAWMTALKLAGVGAVDVLLVLRPTGAVHTATSEDGQGLTPPGLPVLDGVRVAYLADLAQLESADQFAGTLPRPGDFAALFHTGGTTGLPKLAAHRQINQTANAWMIAANGLLSEGSSVFAALPLFHVNALVVTVLAPLLRGQPVVWAGPDGYRDIALYGEFWKIVEHFRIATLSSVPTVYQVLAGCPIDADTSSLRFTITGASSLPTAVKAAFEGATGVPLLEGYGLTEATCATARGFVDHPRRGSVGQRLPYQQVKAVRIADDGTWHDLPAGEPGVLAISGPTVFAGYVTGFDEDGPVVDGLGKLVGGWLDTGDLGKVDEQGFVYLTGRAKDLIIRGGHNIDPAAIEDALLAHPAVTGAAAVGRPDLHAGEVPVAYVTALAGSDVTETELIAWATARVGEKAAVPKSVTVVDALPVTDVGKPYKVALCADAVGRAVADVLAGVPGVVGVEGRVIDGAVVAVVLLAPAAGASASAGDVAGVAAHDHLEAAVAAALSGLAVTYRTEPAA